MHLTLEIGYSDKNLRAGTIQNHVCNISLYYKEINWLQNFVFLPKFIYIDNLLQENKFNLFIKLAGLRNKNTFLFKN